VPNESGRIVLSREVTCVATPELQG